MKLFKYLLLAFLVSGSVLSSHAQVDPDDIGKNWKKLVRKADLLMKKGSYYNAIDYYKEVLDLKPNLTFVSWNLGQAYESARDYKQAEKYYLEAFEAEPKQYLRAQLRYALMLKYNGKYKKAITQFKEFQKSIKKTSDEWVMMKKRARVEVKGCDLALELLSQETPLVAVDNAGARVNDEYTEFSPRLMNDSTLVFGSLRIMDGEEGEIIRIEDEEDQMERARLFESKLQTGGNWSEAKFFDAPFNDTSSHVGNLAFSMDGKRAYFTRCTDEQGQNLVCDIYVSRKKRGRWENPTKLPFNTDEYSETHPFIGPYKDGEVIYFASNREGGRGGYDLYFSIIQNDGKDYKDPKNLGSRVNTPLDELTPFFDHTDSVMYFSSNGLPGVGGFDVFKTKGLAKKWASPVNMGFPINSSVDDLYYIHKPGMPETGFLVSNRKGSIALKSETCCDDIWLFRPDVPPSFWAEVEVYIQTPEGEVGPIDSANVSLYQLSGTSKLDSARTVKNEKLVFYLGEEVYDNFRIEAFKPNSKYVGSIETTSTIGLEEADTLKVKCVLRDPDMETDEAWVTIRDVFFILDKDKIEPQSKKALDTIVALLKVDPSLVVEIGAHTDARADDEYNDDLSTRRAANAVKYLISRGIDSVQLNYKGYGEQKILNQCKNDVRCTEIEHMLNRRIEMRIIGKLRNKQIYYDKRERTIVERLKELDQLEKYSTVWDFEGKDDLWSSKDELEAKMRQKAIESGASGAQEKPEKKTFPR